MKQFRFNTFLLAVVGSITACQPTPQQPTVTQSTPSIISATQVNKQETVGFNSKLYLFAYRRKANNRFVKDAQKLSV